MARRGALKTHKKLTGVEMVRSRLSRSGFRPGWLLLGCLLAVTACERGGGPSEFLGDPASAEVNMTAPETFQARFETSKGTFVVEAHRQWAPNGVDRFYNLVENGFFDDVRFFRVIAGFMAQFGINGNPEIQSAWRDANIQDDPVVVGNTRGRISFAQTSMPNSRSTQLFINFGDNSRLDGMGFAAIGEVISGMEVVDALYSEYGEGAPGGSGPSQGRIQEEGNVYLEAEFAELDYIERATISSEN